MVGSARSVHQSATGTGWASSGAMNAGTMDTAAPTIDLSPWSGGCSCRTPATIGGTGRGCRRSSVAQREQGRTRMAELLLVGETPPPTVRPFTARTSRQFGTLVHPDRGPGAESGHGDNALTGENPR